MIFLRSCPSEANKHVYNFPSTESLALLHPLQNGSVIDEIKPTEVFVLSMDHFCDVEDLLVSINDELVSLFLHNKISFDDISNKLKQIIAHKIFIKYRHKKLQNLTQIEKLNEFVRLKTKSLSVISERK